MNELTRLVFVLVFVTVIATILLSLVHTITEPLIEKSRNNTLLRQLQYIFPSSDSIREVGDHFEVYSEGKTIGYAALTEAKGYSSTITILVGVDDDGKILGVTIIKQQETPGLGTRITDSQFLNQFIGKSYNSIALRKDGGEIDGITGATISSRAVTQAVKTTVEKTSR